MMKPGSFYHVYNHANGKEDLFKNDRDYRYFLKKLFHHIKPIAEIHAYCMMPNHFHLLIKVKSNEALEVYFSRKKNFNQEKIGLYISRQFSNLFSAYALGYNLKYRRRGSLFFRPFKYKIIHSDSYLIIAFLYIHRNPVKHRYCSRCDEWQYSSYHEYLKQGSPDIQTDFFLYWFKSKEHLIDKHSGQTCG